MEKIRDRIRKLLRLARDKGASENEAANALAMASRLMLEHNIEHVGDDEEVSRVVRGSWMNVDRGSKWEMIAAAAAATMFNCRHVVMRRAGDHQFVGKPENIEACEDTFTWICEQIEELYKEGLKAFRHEMGLGSLSKSQQRDLRADFRTTFKEACALRVFRRAGEIIAANRGNIPSHMALVVIDKSLEEADALIKGLKKGRQMTVRKSGLGTGAGLAAGEAVRLQEGMKDNRRGDPAALRIGKVT